MADNKEELGFDHSGVGIANGRYFGMPFPNDECPVVLVSVPWDATVSYSDGTSGGPEAMINASIQVDLYDEHLPSSPEFKIGTDETEIDMEQEGGRIKVYDYIKAINGEARTKACRIIINL